jgi:tripartite ATP-independent transporter DctP family solute receptor
MVVAVCFLVLAILAFSSVNVSSAATVTLKMGHDVAPTHPWHQGALRLAELVNKKTNGEVKIEVFPSSQLGDLRELMELTQTSSIDFNMNTSGVAASFIPDMNLLNLPFLFNDRDQLKKFYESPLARKILDSGEKNRIKGFAFHTYVFRGPMNNKRTIKSAEDFKGLKIRLMQVPIHMDTYKALGSSPVAIPFSELYTAAQMGTVDGFENSAVTLYHQKLYEVGKYYSTLPVFAYTNVILGSMKTWNEKLNESQRKAFLESLPEAVAMINKGSDEGEEVGLKKFRDSGVQVNTGPFELKPFREAMKPVYDKWAAGLSKDAQDILKDLQKQWK